MADWTEADARAYLPRLRGLLAVIRRAAGLAVRARTNGHAAVSGRSPRAAETGSEPTAVDDVELPRGMDGEQALAELEERGIILRDGERGLVDFPSRHASGQAVLLCWQLGEDDLEWWHLPEEGFAGRRPLPLPPQL
ncbi:MAG: DUF2203 domain-containing protein [Acidimicrobiales bacterium]